MKRLRMAACAAVAGLSFISGCGTFDGHRISNFFSPRQECCEMSQCSSGGCSGGCSSCGGSMPYGGEGPMLGDPYNQYNTQPPPAVQELPGSKIAPQAQPMPANPVSTTKK